MRIWYIVFEIWTKVVSGGPKMKKLRLSKKHVHIELGLVTLRPYRVANWIENATQWPPV